MPEEKSAGVAPEVKPEQASQEAELRAELARAQASGRMFRSATVALSVIFAMILVVAFMGYRKVMQAKALVEGISQGFQQFGAKTEYGETIPEPLRAVSASNPIPTSASGLGLLSMPDSEAPEAPGVDAAAEENKEKILKVLNKYAGRPLVKEFLAELAKDPDYSKSKKTGNTFGMIAGMRKSPRVKALIASYSRRPEFLKLMMEVMQDPEMMPLMKGMPGGAAAMAGAMPSAPSRAPAAQRYSQPQDSPEPENSDPDGDGELTFDASAISGAAKPSKPVVRSGGKPPPPVDSGQ